LLLGGENGSGQRRENIAMNILLRTAGLISVLLLVSPFAVSAQNVPAADAAGVVTGVATYRERIAMPKNAVFEAKLEDVSKMDAPAEPIGTAVMENPGNPPYHFSISYDPRRIVDNHTYAVRATIQIGEQLAFTSDTSYPVITRGNGKEVNILLTRAGGHAAPAVSGESHGGTPLENTNWKLTWLAEKDVAANDTQRTPYIFLDPAGSRVSGSGGCNRLSGTYRVDKQTIRFGPTSLTMMACPSGMDREKDFMEALGETRKWKIQDNELEVYDEDGKLLVRFEGSEAK
jgi:putative lipoprotein